MYRVDSFSRTEQLYFLLLSALITAAVFLFFPLVDSLVKDRVAYKVRRIDFRDRSKAEAKAPPSARRIPAGLMTVPAPAAAPVKNAVGVDSFKPEFPEGLAAVEGPGAFRFEIGQELEDPGPVFDVAEVEMPPQPISQMLPVYPFRARMLGVEGRVEILFVVRVDGRVGQVQIVSSTPPGYFEETVRQMVSRWVFKPGTRNRQAVATWVKLALKFELKDRKGTEQ